MPSTAQRASALILRFNLWRWVSSSSHAASRHASNSPKPFSWRLTIPRSIQRVARVNAFRNALSWLMIMYPLRVALSSDSSHAIASISRWLVGSSSNIRSGAPAIKRAKAARRRSPPDAVSTGRAGSNLRPAPARSTLYISPSSSPWDAKSPNVAKPDRSGSCSI